MILARHCYWLSQSVAHILDIRHASTSQTYYVSVLNLQRNRCRHSDTWFRRSYWANSLISLKPPNSTLPSLRHSENFAHFKRQKVPMDDPVALWRDRIVQTEHGPSWGNKGVVNASSSCEQNPLKWIKHFEAFFFIFCKWASFNHLHFFFLISVLPC